MKQKIALVLVTLMGLALLGYTALRTLDLIQLTLPVSQQAVGYLALVAFDGGLVGWTLFYLHGAKGAWQRAIATMMIVVSLAGVLIAFATDTFYQSAARGTIATIDPAFVSTAIWGMVAVIGANVGAVVGIHLTDPEARKAQAEEEARDKITEAVLKKIASNAEILATELAPQIGEAWVSDMRAQYANNLSITPSVTRESALSPTPMYGIGETQPMPALKPGKNGNGRRAGSDVQSPK
jgi:hypothetical protein